MRGFPEIDDADARVDAIKSRYRPKSKRDRPATDETRLGPLTAAQSLALARRQREQGATK